MSSAQPHRITRMHCITAVYEWLEDLDKIKLQALNKRHYEAIIPFYLSTISMGSHRVISF
jgi:hypothetical protein